MLSPKQITDLVAVLQREVGELRALYLYGSRAGDAAYAKKDSDWDLAFLAEGRKALNSAEKFYLAAKLADVLNADYVDLVDLRERTSHVLWMNIIDGDRVWTRDYDEAVAWESKEATIANDFFFRQRELRQAQIDELRSRVS